MKWKSKEGITGIAVISGLVLFVIWLSGVPGVAINGISYVAENEDRFHHLSATLEEDYSVEIGLSDFENNTGRILYEDDDGLEIYIDEVGQNPDGNYYVNFRSSGSFGPGGASLVSAIEHVRTEGGFSSIVQADAYLSVNGDTYELQNTGATGLNYRDGDMFYFTLTGEGEEPDLDGVETVKLTLSDLQRNIWIRA